MSIPVWHFTAAILSIYDAQANIQQFETGLPGKQTNPITEMLAGLVFWVQRFGLTINTNLLELDQQVELLMHQIIVSIVQVGIATD